MSDDDNLAERIARAEIGENHWPRHSAWFRRYVIDDWRKRIEMIRRARFDIVEREDGR